MMTDQDMIDTTFLWIILTLSLSLLVFLWAWDSHTRFRRAIYAFMYAGTRYPLEEMEEIYAKTFTNESVVLDGKAFHKCKFVNVTFVFHGTAPFYFVKCMVEGSLAAQTDHVAAQDFAYLGSIMRKLRLENSVISGGKDD